MCGCTSKPIGDYCSVEKLHINWHGEAVKMVDTAPVWATGLVEGVSGGHRQTFWVDNVAVPTWVGVKGCMHKGFKAPDDFKVVHVVVGYCSSTRLVRKTRIKAIKKGFDLEHFKYTPKASTCIWVGRGEEYTKGLIP